MILLGDVVRILNIVLCIGYLPLLAVRYHAEGQRNRTYLVGVFFVLTGIICGSVLRLGETFRWSLPLVTVGVALMFYASARTQRESGRR